LTGLLFIAIAVAIHYGIEFGFLVGGFAVLTLPSPSHPPVVGQQRERVRAMVGAAQRRLRGRRQAAAAVAMVLAIVGLGVGIGLAWGAAWGLVAVAVVTAGLSLRADSAG